LFKPQERGLSVKIGEWCFELMLDVDGHGAWKTKPYFRELGKEDFLWFVEDVIEAAERCGQFDGVQLIDATRVALQRIYDTYEQNEEEYWRQVEGKGRRVLIKNFSQLRRTSATPLSRMKDQYAWLIGFCTTGSFASLSQDCGGPGPLNNGAAFIWRIQAMGIRDRPVSARSPSARSDGNVLITSSSLASAVFATFSHRQNAPIAAEGPPVRRDVCQTGRVRSSPILGGLHHQYVRV
jgi:hypothetical protein